MKGIAKDQCNIICLTATYFHGCSITRGVHICTEAHYREGVLVLFTPRLSAVAPFGEWRKHWIITNRRKHLCYLVEPRPGRAGSSIAPQCYLKGSSRNRYTHHVYTDVLDETIQGGLGQPEKCFAF